MLGRMIKTTTRTTRWAILFWLWFMYVILILIHSVVTLIIGPNTTASSKLLRTLAMASASVAIYLISLEVGFVVIAVLSMVLLKCTSLKSITLKLILTILRSLTSKLSVTTLTIKRSAALTLSWGIIIIIVITIVRAIICVVQQQDGLPFL